MMSYEESAAEIRRRRDALIQNKKNMIKKVITVLSVVLLFTVVGGASIFIGLDRKETPNKPPKVTVAPITNGEAESSEGTSDLTDTDGDSASSESVTESDPEPTDSESDTEREPVTTESESQPTEPKPTEPKPTEPKPTEPKPTEPKPTEPKPTEPKPTEPKPTEPKPTEPKPTEPKPTEPKPTEPKPTEPKPTEPKPTEPKPTEPKPTEPTPTEPIPTDTEPSDTDPIPDGPVSVDTLKSTTYYPENNSSGSDDNSYSGIFHDFSGGTVEPNYYNLVFNLPSSYYVGDYYFISAEDLPDKFPVYFIENVDDFNEDECLNDLRNALGDNCEKYGTRIDVEEKYYWKQYKKYTTEMVLNNTEVNVRADFTYHELLDYVTSLPHFSVMLSHVDIDEYMVEGTLSKEDGGGFVCTFYFIPVTDDSFEAMVYRVSKYVKIQVMVGCGNNNITFTATNTPFKIYDYISYENCYNKVYERLTQYFECFGVSDYCEANIVCELRSVETNSHILPMLSFQIAFNDNNGNILYYEPCVEGFVENHPWLPDGKRVASSYIGQSSFLTMNDSMTIKQMPEFIRRSEQNLEYEYYW